MPKISRGRLDGVHGMKSFTATELFALADSFERQVSDPLNADDPRWLKRWATKLRHLADRKQQMLLHKKHAKRTTHPNEVPLTLVLMTCLARTPSSAFGTFSHRDEAATGEGYSRVRLSRDRHWVAFSTRERGEGAEGG